MKFEALFGTFIVIVLVASLAIMVFSNIQSTQNVNSTEYNATGKGLITMQTFNEYMPIFVLVMVLIFVIVMTSYLAVKYRQRRI